MTSFCAASWSQAPLPLSSFTCCSAFRAPAERRRSSPWPTRIRPAFAQLVARLIGRLQRRGQPNLLTRQVGVGLLELRAQLVERFVRLVQLGLGGGERLARVDDFGWQLTGRGDLVELDSGVGQRGLSLVEARLCRRQHGIGRPRVRLVELGLRAAQVDSASATAARAATTSTLVGPAFIASSWPAPPRASSRRLSPGLRAGAIGRRAARGQDLQLVAGVGQAGLGLHHRRLGCLKVRDFGAVLQVVELRLRRAVRGLRGGQVFGRGALGQLLQFELRDQLL